jgi:hypothetical protein
MAFGGDKNPLNDALITPPPAPLIITSEIMDKKWSRWLQQFEWWAISTDFDKKTAKKKVAIFMTVVEVDAISIYNSFGLTEAEKNDVEAIKTKFTTYFTSTKPVSMERFLFHGIRQEDCEKSMEFFARIKLQAEKCEFSQLKNDFVRDQIVIGMRDKSLQKQLFRESALTLEKAENTCRVAEETDENIWRMNQETQAVVASLDRMKISAPEHERSAKSTKPYDCKRCGMKHVYFKCPAFKKKCGKCRRLGHVTEKCRVGNRVDNVNKKEDSEFSSEDEEFMHELCVDSLCKTKTSNDWNEKITINGTEIIVKLDTGAQCNVLPLSICSKRSLKLSSSRTRNLISYSNHRIKVLGEVNQDCVVRGVNYKLLFKVIDLDVLPILGRDSCASTGLLLRVETITDDDLFNGLGCLKGYEYELDLKPISK